MAVRLANEVGAIPRSLACVVLVRWPSAPDSRGLGTKRRGLSRRTWLEEVESRRSIQQVVRCFPDEGSGLEHRDRVCSCDRPPATLGSEPSRGASRCPARHDERQRMFNGMGAARPLVNRGSGPVSVQVPPGFTNQDDLSSATECPRERVWCRPLVPGEPQSVRQVAGVTESPRIQ